MNSNNDEDSLRDDAWEENFFSLILELSEKNSSRYENQALTLLKNKTLEISFGGVSIKYRITPTGCWFYTSENVKGHSRRGWNRMGWRKSSKIKALPSFFAGSEAGVLLDL